MILAILDCFFVRLWRALLSVRGSGAESRDGAKDFAIVSYYLPPSWSGGAIVLSRILAGVPANAYCLISRFAYSDQQGDEFIPRLPAKYFHVPGKLYVPTSEGVLRQWAYVLREVGHRALRIAEILKAERVRTVVATTGDLIEVPAAFVASRIAGARFVLYVFDDFVSQWWQFPAAEKMARLFERHLVNAGAGLIAPNEHMANELRARYGAQCAIVRNPTAPPVTGDARGWRPIDTSRPVSVLYTGAVYAVNEDTMASVADALTKVDEVELRLILYTAQKGLFAESSGHPGRVDVRAHVPPSEIEKIQQAADILLLPFTFDGNAATLIETSGTAKLADYLASGRPVLAVAPPDSFLAEYLASNDCGFVCTSNDPGDIAAMLRLIVADQDRCAAVCANARRCAARDFLPADATAAFTRAVGAGETRR